MKHNLLKSVIISVILLMGVSNAWADTGFEDNSSTNGIKYYKAGDGADQSWGISRTNQAALDLNDVTGLYLKEFYVHMYQSIDNISGNVKMYYQIKRQSEADGSYTLYIQNNWSIWKVDTQDNNGWKDGWRHPKFGCNSINNGNGINLLDGLGSGKYSLRFYMYEEGSNSHLSNGGSNYTLNWTYNIVPSVNNFKVTASNVVSGTGTSVDPYVIACGKTTTLTVSGNKASTDANSSLYAKFGDNTYSSTLTKNLTPNSTTQSIQVKAKYYNSKDNLSGTETTTQTIYYRAQTFAVNITSSGDGTVTPSGTQQVGATTVPITATPEIGSAFKQWEVIGGAKVENATSATTTITATAAGTVKAIFEEKPATTIYLEPTGNWNSDKAVFQAHVWQIGKDGVNLDMVDIGDPSHADGDNKSPYRYYKVEVPYGYDKILFFRKDNFATANGNAWNKTGNLTIPTDDKVLYTITSAGKGQAESYNPAATGEWKEANLVYTITLGYCEFGTYRIKYNGQSYFSKQPNENVTLDVPAGAQIEILEGQPFNNAYRGDVIKAKPTSATLSSGQKLTVNGDIMLDDNFVTKESHVVYLGVPESYAKWNTTEINNGTQTYYIWRKTSTGALNMNAGDAGEHVFDKDGIKYYKFTIAAGCNNFCFQRKATVTNGNYATTTFQETQNLLFQIPLTEVNCYTLTNDNSGTWGILPAQAGDYRLLYVEQVVEKDADGYTIITRKKVHPSDIIRKRTESGVDTVSLHTYKDRKYAAKLGDGLDDYESSNNPEIILQKYIGNDQWQDVECQMVYGPLETLPIMANLPGRKNASPNSTIDDLQHQDGIDNIKNDTHPDKGNGVWNFVVTQDGAGNASVQWDQTHRYTGKYYIRTDNAEGGWNQYTLNDNYMTRSDVSKQHSNYSHYYCKWVKTVGTNVKFTIANDYGIAISDTLEADTTDIWGTPITAAQRMVGDDQLLPASANVRFAWNEKSNFLHRAYLAGSGEIGNRFLVVEGEDSKILNADGQPLVAAGYNKENPRSNLSNNEEIFNDISNWVYYADVQLAPNAGLKVTAKYYEKVQYFVGQESNWNNTILKSEEECSDKYLIRLLYDFKTNELISAYVPGGQEGKEIEAIETNLMLIRKENETPRQLSFNANKMEDVGKQAYGVLELTQATLEDNDKNVYERSLYWISFPFDVRITDIFGFGEYGKHWIIQSYDGAKRAREGLWADSETNWVYHFDPNTLNAGTPDQGIMKRGVGYVVALNLKNIQAETPFVGRITTIALYFPSTTTITGHIVNTNAVSISVPEHECTINRPTPDGDRRIKDSHWNVIGVPSYINALGDFSGKISAIAEDVKFYYSWQGDHDKYEPVSKKSGVSFNSLNAYMVQFAGNLQWTNVLNEEAPAGMAAKRNSDNMQEHHLCLELQQNGQEQDRTFIQLQEDEVTTAFDFNYDLCKIINKGANIYSLIATDRDPIEVAGNVLPVEEAIIPLGIKTDAAGEYTFAMPEGTDGIVVELIDYETNTRTNMLLDNYTVNLGKGTFDNRFALHVKPDKTTTSVDNIGNEATGDKVKKYLIDGVLYMQKDGVLYDAQGRKL